MAKTKIYPKKNCRYCFERGYEGYFVNGNKRTPKMCRCIWKQLSKLPRIVVKQMNFEIVPRKEEEKKDV